MIPVAGGDLQLIVGLGANLGDPSETFRSALALLAREYKILGVSSLYRTRPVGPEQPDFFNLAVVFDAGCPPSEFLKSCRDLETDAGRDRKREERWGPRVLDLDLLLAESFVCRGPSLVLPHPRFHERAFALAPAADVASEWMHPILGIAVGDLASAALRADPGAIIEVLSF